MTTADPEPQADGRGRHARSDDHEDDPAPQEEPSKDEPAEEPPPKPKGATRAAPPEEAPPKRPFQPIGRHPAGVPLLIAAGLVTGISLLPLLLDRLNWSVAREAAANASSAAAPWPAAAEPWFSPGWVAETAFLVSAAVLVLALIGLKLPDVVVLVLAAVLTATTAWAALATLDVLEAGLWELIPLCILCVVAFGLAGTATARWRSDPAFTGDERAGGVLSAALATWLVVAIVLLAGAAIADSVRTRALGDASPQGVPGLLAVRATDAPQLEGYRGLWLAQLIRAQVGDDEQGSAYAARHAQRSAGFPTLLVRGDDTGAPDLDDTWWVTLVRQSFGSQADVQAWCSRAGLAPPDCTPILISG